LYLCAVLTASCASGTDGGTASNTELNLDIVNPDGTSGELGFSIDRVDYRITCANDSHVLPPFDLNPAGAAGDPCSLADVDTNGIPDVCPPGSNYIAGTAGPDNIVGTNQADCIFGMGGNDVIQGGNQQDYICGGSGNDDIDGGNAHDFLHGGDGNDIINGGSNGGDTLLGGAGNDQLFGSTGNDLLIGGDGDDALVGDTGDDSLDGGPGIDTLDGALGNDMCVEEVPGTSIRLTNCEYGYGDSVDISGAFETVDTRVPPVWQAVMDLPPGLCTITLSVWDGNEVVCIGSQTLTINEDGTTKYDIVLVCSLSIDLPDGMADVDGEFFFITGNLCPKLYVLNAIPSGQPPTALNPTGTPIPVQAAGPYTGQAVTEVQYRAKDPDNTCGNNCDPQSCTFDNPPVCTPYPSNINDPACNPLAGGDPNSVDCQAGVYAGLVCTISAWPSASNPGGPNTGPPGGTFISPQDLTTPVGPILPVNLNLASGIPGLILPGLGGPVTTSSEPTGGAPGDNPLYPGLPNVNGSLPPLYYSCDLTQPGPTFILLQCSDGDAECDQAKLLTLICPGENFCISSPVDCSGSSECLTDGVCDPFCDPADIGGPGCPAGTRCPGQDNNLPDGTACTEGGGTQCLAGVCVECVTDAGCATNPAPPVDCQLPNTCVANNCVAGGTAPSGTPCSNGVCDGTGIGLGACQFVPVDPAPVTQQIDVGCGNNVTADVSILPYELTVDPGPIISGQPVTAALDGVAVFSEAFLDAAQGAISGGVQEAGLVDLIANVQVRGDISGANVPLVGDTTIPNTCLYSGGPCDPANNLASVPGLQPNTDCTPQGKFNPCLRVVTVPTSTDCAPGGLCDTLGKAAQCAANGFCAISGLPLDLDAGVGSYTAGASGTARWGWYDTPADASPGIGTPAIDGDGTYNVLQPTYTGVSGPVGLAVNAGGLTVQLECVMAVDSGGPDGTVPPVPDDASPTPDSVLISFPVQVP
jgi:hypothetical protein